MLAAARRAVSLTEVRARQDLDGDDVLALALTHLLEILGEAAKGVSSETKDRYPDLPWSQMAATRDRLIHGYFSVDLDIVWQIARHDLPSVVAALETMVPDEKA
ncbi:MAG: DUF86 domain-containing protein [Dehalococcoidia bacterium]|nr:MAG: DUF86 domain-containing protein [Dehalococcoidia bacterium]